MNKIKNTFLKWVYYHFALMTKVEIQSETQKPIIYISLHYFPKGDAPYWGSDMFSAPVMQHSYRVLTASSQFTDLLDYIKIEQNAPVSK